MINKVNFKAYEAPEFKSDIASENQTSVNPDSFGSGDIGEDLNNTANSIFGNPSTDNSSAANPFDMQVGSEVMPGSYIDQATGQLVTDPYSTPYYIKSIEEYMSDSRVEGVSLTLEDYDKLKEAYKSGVEDLNAAKAEIISQIEDGMVAAGDYKKALYVIKCIESSIVKAQEAVLKIDPYKAEAMALYQEEMTTLYEVAKEGYDQFNKAKNAVERSAIIESKFQVVDKNLDGWIGEPEKGLRIDSGLEFADGTKGSAIYDPASGKYLSKFTAEGKPVTQKWYDPNQDWVVTTHGLKKVDGGSNAEDLVLQTTGATATEINNHFGAKVDIAIPDYITVQADPSGNPLINSISTKTRYMPAAFVQDEKGIHQPPISADQAQYYVQMRVDKVVIKSEKRDDGSYDNIYTFKGNGGTVTLAEFRVLKGAEVGNAINGDQRTISVIIDASEQESLFQHAMDSGTLSEIKSYYDVDLDLENSAQGANAEAKFNETMDKFTSNSQKVEKDSELATGLMVDFRKIESGTFVEGSASNNITLFGDPSKQQEINPYDGSDEINGFYSNGFKGYSGASRNAIFQKGGGDLYAEEVTLAWRDSTDEDAITAIHVKASLGTEEYEEDGETKTRSTTAPTFLYLGGSGDKYVDNAVEKSTKKVKAGEKAEQNKGDDFWYGERIQYTVSNVKDDGDIGDLDANSQSNTDPTEGFPNGLDDVESDIMKRLGDLTNEEDDPYSGLMSDDLGGYYYSESYNEMRSAFDELATGLNFKNNGSWLEEEYDGDEDLAENLNGKVNGVS